MSFTVKKLDIKNYNLGLRVLLKRITVKLGNTRVYIDVVNVRKYGSEESKNYSIDEFIDIVLDAIKNKDKNI